MSRLAVLRRTQPRLFGRLLAVAATMCMAVPLALGVSTGNPAGAVDFAGLRVQGNVLKNASGETVRLLGVNKMGTEYACIQGWGIFEGPSDAASIAAMQTWGVNTVRVPLNQDCWLNVNTSGLNTSYVGAGYRQAIIDYVNLITSRGLVAIVELHWNAPGSFRASSQAPMPDADHSPAFWTSVANTFQTNDRVVFDLFNEPYPDNNSDSAAAWTCWRDGGMCATYSGSTYQVAGMQTLVNTVRATGATNVIMVPGIRYSNAMSQWLTYRPTDPLNNLAAAWHVYNFNACVTVTCWNAEIAPVAAVVPLITGEIGENDCAHGFIDGLMDYLDSIGASYLAWAWNTNSCGGTPALISSFDGTPTPYGVGFRDHLLSVTGGGTTSTTLGSTAPPTTTTATTTVPTTVAPTTGPGTTVVSPSGIRVRIEFGGTDNNQQSQFHVAVANTGASAQTGVSFRVYFSPDGSEPASKYTFDKYWDSSNNATINGPTAGPNGTYYFTVSYGSATLAPGSSWLLHLGFHLTDWASTFSGTNDHWHTGYPLALLPAAYTDTQHLPGYVNGTLVWGVEPAGTEPPPTTVPPTTVPPTTVPPTTVPPTTVPPTTVPPTTVPPTTVPPTTTPPTTVVSATGIRVSIQNGGSDNNQQSQFRIRVENTRSTSVTNLSVRVYFTLDGTNKISNYVLERYYDQSGGSTTSAPTKVSGSTYRYTISFGTKVLPANSSWEWHGSLHLVNWATTFSAVNDRFHNGFAVGSLPSTYTQTVNVPAFIGTTNVWGTP